VLLPPLLLVLLPPLLLVLLPPLLLVLLPPLLLAVSEPESWSPAPVVPWAPSRPHGGGSTCSDSGAHAATAASPPTSPASAHVQVSLLPRIPLLLRAGSEFPRRSQLSQTIANREQPSC
jgi:hypothetical protein